MGDTPVRVLKSTTSVTGLSFWSPTGGCIWTGTDHVRDVSREFRGAPPCGPGTVVVEYGRCGLPYKTTLETLVGAG